MVIKKGGKNNQNNSSQASNSNVPKVVEHSYSYSRETLCSTSEKEGKDDDSCIQCELCQSWFCLECIGMSEAFYNELASSDQSDNVIWDSCTCCV